jgi:hypothetical protein
LLSAQTERERERERELNLAPRSENLPIPKRISDSDFDEICESFKISPKKNRDMLRAVIDGATAGIAEFQTQQRSQPHRRKDRKLVADAISALEKVGERLDRLGPEGKETLRDCDYFLSPVVSTRWLHQQFPNDSLAPKIAGLAADFEDRSLDQRRLFIWNRPSLAINAVLAELGQGFNATLSELKSRPGAKGGRKRAIGRQLMIQSIIRAWTTMGRKVSTGSKSDFMNFVAAITSSTGWSERGLPTAVAKAVKDWRNRQQKKAR